MKRLWILGLGLLLAGCGVTSADGNDGPSVAVLHGDAFCGTTKPAVRWLDGRRAVMQALGRRRADRDGVLAAVRGLDFNARAVVEISLGQRDSAGYAVRLADTTALIERQVLRLRVRVEAPAPDAITAQVVTSPCLMVVVPRGDYRRVRVVDVDGQPLGSANLP